MEVYKQGETIIIRQTVRDTDGDLATPSTYTMTVVDSIGQTTVDAQTMTNTGSATGLYHYNYTIATDAKTGTYQYEGIHTDASSLVAKGCGEFEVEEKL